MPKTERLGNSSRPILLLFSSGSVARDANDGGNRPVNADDVKVLDAVNFRKACLFVSVCVWVAIVHCLLLCVGLGVLGGAFISLERRRIHSGMMLVVVAVMVMCNRMMIL